MKTEEQDERNEQIYNLAEEVRQHWANEWESFSLRFGKEVKFPKTARWDGGIDASGRKHSNIWLKIAKFIVDNNLDPELLVRAQYYEYSASEPPFPTVLMSQRGIEKLNKYKDIYIDNVIKAIKIQEDAFKLALWNIDAIYKQHAGRKQNTHFVLTDIKVPLTALFRYMKAQQIGSHVLMDNWKNEALKQYLKAPAAYDTYWSAIPIEFKKYVRNT